MARVLSLLLAVVLSVLGVTLPARAEPPRVLLLVRASQPEAAVQRVFDELVAAGFTVEKLASLETSESAQRAELVRLVRSRSALAAVHPVLDGEDKQALVFILNPDTKESGHALLTVPNNAKLEPTGVLALRVAELLQTTLVQVLESRPQRRARPRPAPSDRYGARLGAFALTAPGGLGLFAGPRLGGFFELHPRLLVDVEVSASVLGSRIEVAASDARAAQNRAQLGIALARAQLLATLLRARSVQLGLGLGAGPLFAYSEGSPSTEYSVQSQTTTVLLVSGGAFARFKLGDSLYLHAAMNAGVLLPKLQVYFGKNVVADSRTPALDAALALEWTWGELR